MFYAGLSQQKGYRRPMLGGLGAVGDVSIAAWQQGTFITYEKDGVIPNSFSTYKDSNVQAAFAASGLFIPTSVSFVSSPNFLGLSYKIKLQGSLAATVNQADVARVIEGLLPNFYAKGYGSPAVYSPPPNTSQTVNSSTGLATGSDNTVSQAATPASFGITSAGQYADGSTYVALSDGSVLSFDNQGDPVSEDFGLSGVSFAIAYDDGTTGVVMTDGTEFMFDANGRAIVPASIANTIQTVATGIQTVTTNPGGTPPPKKSGLDEFLDSLGLSKIPLSLGVGSGVVVAGLAVAAYLVATSNKR